MNILRKTISVALAFSLFVSLPGCGVLSTGGTATGGGSQGGDSDPTVLTMTFALSETSPHYPAGLRFAELVEEYTNGAYTVEVYPNSTLAGGNQLGAIEMVQQGTISCGFLSPLVQSAIVPDLNALCIPYLWKDYESIDAALTPGSDVDKALNAVLADSGYIAIAYAENGYREVTNSVRELRTPEDFKGIQFRVIGSNMLFDFFRALGANPMDMDFSELFTGLQQGAVDGQENPISTAILPQRYYEVQDYMTIWDYSYEPHPLMFNLELWNSFDADTQAAIQQAAVEACEYQRQLSRETVEEGIQTMREAGMQVYELSEEEKDAFRAVAAPIVEQYSAEFDPDLMAALNAANE